MKHLIYISLVILLVVKVFGCEQENPLDTALRAAQSKQQLERQAVDNKTTAAAKKWAQQAIYLPDPPLARKQATAQGEAKAEREKKPEIVRRKKENEPKRQAPERQPSRKGGAQGESALTAIAKGEGPSISFDWPEDNTQQRLAWALLKNKGAQVVALDQDLKIVQAEHSADLHHYSPLVRYPSPQFMVIGRNKARISGWVVPIALDNGWINALEAKVGKQVMALSQFKLRLVVDIKRSQLHLLLYELEGRPMEVELPFI